MAHTCPICGAICYCSGDIDDILIDAEDDVLGCTHCNEYDDFDDYEID